MFNRLIQYFQTLEEHPLQRMAILAGSLLFFWVIKGASPLLTLKYKKKAQACGTKFQLYFNVPGHSYFSRYPYN